MRLVIPASVLDEARFFLEEAGSWGHEGTGFLIGRPADNEDRVSRFMAPDQRAGSAGGWVEVTEQGKLELAGTLHPDERYFARIHSHPADAFHSPTDDANPGLTAEGAWSIVVPYFGLGLRRGLGACGIYRLHGRKWVRVPKERLERDIRVVNDGSSS
jgi:hypothetical protein